MSLKPLIARFAFDDETGALTFVEAPDYEAPADSDGDNIYEGCFHSDRTV